MAVTAACQLFGLALVSASIETMPLSGIAARTRATKILGMGVEDGGLVALRRLDAVERGKGLVVEHALDGAQAVWPLGMTGRRQMFEEDRMGVEPGDHDPI